MVAKVDMAYHKAYKTSMRGTTHITQTCSSQRCMFIPMDDLPSLTLQQLSTYDINAWTCE